MSVGNPGLDPALYIFRDRLNSSVQETLGVLNAMCLKMCLQKGCILFPVAEKSDDISIFRTEHGDRCPWDFLMPEILDIVQADTHIGHGTEPCVECEICSVEVIFSFQRILVFLSGSTHAQAFEYSRSCLSVLRRDIDIKRMV